MTAGGEMGNFRISITIKANEIMKIRQLLIMKVCVCVCAGDLFFVLLDVLCVSEVI